MVWNDQSMYFWPTAYIATKSIVRIAATLITARVTLGVSHKKPDQYFGMSPPLAI